jgi:hypothetical protein
LWARRLEGLDPVWYLRHGCGDVKVVVEEEKEEEGGEGRSRRGQEVRTRYRSTV